MPGFLSPLFLLGAAAAAIPVILHLLKRQPEARVKFAAVRLLKEGPVEHTRQRRLRDLLLLALRMTALLLLALAFARPFFVSAQSPSSAVTVIALDTSLSMSAPGRFERARTLAKDALRRAPAGDRVGVLTFSDQVHVASAVTADRTLALAAVDAAVTDAGATSYRAALQAAAALLTDSHGTVTVVTDLQEGGWDGGDRVDLPDSVRVDVVDVGPPSANLAIASLSGEGDRLIASVRNVGSEPRDVRVELTVRRDADARLQNSGEVTVSIGANQSAEAVLPKPAGGAAIVAISDPGGIEADNRRFIVLDDGSRSAVLIVTPTGDLLREAFYVQQALLAGGAMRAAYRVDGVGAVQLGSWDRARLERYAAVVLATTVGLERRGRDLLEEYTRAGGGVLVAAAPGVDGEVVADALGGANTLTMVDVPNAIARTVPRALTPVDARHPVFAAFGSQGASLGLASFRHIAAIRGEGCQTVARFTTGEDAMLDCTRGEGKALVMASDLDNRWNDLPLRPTFVPFMHEAVRYLSGSRSRQSEYIVGEQPAGVARTPGITSLPASADGPAKWVAVNVDPRESNPGRLTPDEFQSAIARLKESAQAEGAPATREARDNEDRQHIWQYLLALVLATLIAESVVANRTA